MVKWVALLILMFLWQAGPALGQDERPPAQFWIEIEPKAGKRFVKEMIVARLHARYVRPVALMKVKPFDLPDFDVVRLGLGKSYTATGDGFSTPAHEQTIALFPKRSGRLTIPPFERTLTYIDRQGKRVVLPLKTKPVELDINAAPVADTVWWLPARKVTIEETWSANPSNLPLGEPVRRTIVVAATAQLPTSLAPSPDLAADGLIVSAATPVRAVAIGLPRGEMHRQRQNVKGPPVTYVESDRPQPISTVTYSWLIRPKGADAVTMPELAVNWFNTDSGREESIVLPARTVAFRDPGPSLEEMEAALGLQRQASTATSLSLANLALAALLFLAMFVATAALVSRPLRAALAYVAEWVRLKGLQISMRRDAADGDATAVWRKAHDMADGLPKDHFSPASAALHQIEAIVFGRRHADSDRLQGATARLSGALVRERLRRAKQAA